MIETLQDFAVLVRIRLAELLSAVPDLSAEIQALLSSSSPTGHASWHITQLLVGLCFMAIGLAAAYVFTNRGQRRVDRWFAAQADSRRCRLGFLLARTALRLLAAVVLAVVGGGLAILFQGGDVQRYDFMLPVRIAAIVWCIWALSSGLTGAGASRYRVVSLSESVAANLTRRVVWIAVIGITAGQAAGWLLRLGATDQFNAYILIRGAGSLVAALLLCVLALEHRAEISRAIAGDERRRTGIISLLAGNWHLLAVGYLLVAWAISFARLLLFEPAALGLVASPIYALFAGVLVYAIMLMLIDYMVDRRRGGSESSSPQSGDVKIVRPALAVLAEHGAAVIAWVAGFALMAWIWGFDLSGDGVIVNIADVALVIFAGWFAYSAVGVLVNERIEREGGITLAEPGEEGGGQGGVSRIAMLLSLFKKFLLVTIVTIVGMIVLSQLGLDIAPLFAGAGVVGLAVGFGAQTLVRDIFSGAFFLMDDAFRLGEYIDVGSVKGTVEKISIRSMQLRHHMGALHTIPFGEITHLTNYSRDWVMMKLKLRVTYDTDIDKVRKLIKKLGQELLEHPEVGEKFMQPLKSQGVYSMEDDTAIIIRVKFMTRPGDQFQTRKVVYQAIRDLFEKEGIQFATKREVVVRVADDDASTPLSSEVAGGAAVAVTESAKKTPDS